MATVGMGLPFLGGCGVGEIHHGTGLGGPAFACIDEGVVRHG